MTIDELLELAQDHVRASKDDDDTACSMRYSATAQAAAQTAQAMDYHRFIERWFELADATTEAQ